MTRDEANQENNSLRHDCYMTSGSVGFISYLELSDFLAIGLAFYLSGQIANNFIQEAPLRLLIIFGSTIAAWFINFGLKRRLHPYPKITEFFFNWWFNGIDYYVPEVDTKTPPLIVTREMTLGHSVEKIEKATAQAAATRRRREQQDNRRRRSRVRKAGQQTEQ